MSCLRPRHTLRRAVFCNGESCRFRHASVTWRSLGLVYGATGSMTPTLLCLLIPRQTKPARTAREGRP
jgi:hypothetical protein